jgi:hypothetical protein
MAPRKIRHAWSHGALEITTCGVCMGHDFWSSCPGKVPMMPCLEITYTLPTHPPCPLPASCAGTPRLLGSPPRLQDSLVKPTGGHRHFGVRPLRPHRNLVSQRYDPGRQLEHECRTEGHRRGRVVRRPCRRRPAVLVHIGGCGKCWTAAT